jgi:YHS domain-containing protein
MTWIIRILLLALLVFMVGRAIWRLFEGIAYGGAETRGGGRSEARSSAKMVRDPVCGTFVVPTRALTASRGGETAWFCSPECRKAWQQR